MRPRASSDNARARRPTTLLLVFVLALVALPTLVVAGGYGRSSLYHELRRTYGLGGREADAEHDDPATEEANARAANEAKAREDAAEKPKDLFHVGAAMDHEELRNQFAKFPDHHDINAQVHRSGLTALKHAILVGNDTYVKTVIELGADTNAKLFGGKAIHFNAGACGVRGSVSILRILLEHGANVTEESDEGYQPVHIAARGWKKYCNDYMSALLEFDDVDPNARRSGGNSTTPLHEAAQKASFHMVKILIDAGGDVNAQDGSGETPLHKAIRGDHAHAAWGLIQHGADIFIKNKRGHDIEALAKLIRAPYDTMEMIRKHKESLEAKNQKAKDEL